MQTTMNFFDYNKQFWRYGTPLRVNDSAFKLYFFLIDRFNRARWPKKLRITHKEISDVLGIFPNAIKSARKELENEGLIGFIPGPNPRSGTEYFLRERTEPNVSATDNNNISSPDNMNMTAADNKTQEDIVCDQQNPPTPPYICIQDKIKKQDSLFKTTKRERAGEEFLVKERIISEQPHPSEFDIHTLLDRFLCEGNRPMLELFASRNGIPYEELWPLAEEVINEWLLSERQFYSYTDAARSLQNLIRTKHYHINNQSFNSQSNDARYIDVTTLDFGPDPFAPHVLPQGY